MPVLETPRLLLRRWRDEDRAPFAALNADPLVMEHFPAPLSGTESDALADRIAAGLDQRGVGIVGGRVTGVAGVHRVRRPQPGDGRRPVHARGRGRLAAGARALGSRLRDRGRAAALDFGFDDLALDEIVSFTTHGNLRSRRVMERLGMHHDATDDFDNPNIAEGHPLRPHVLYRLDRGSWRRSQAR